MKNFHFQFQWVGYPYLIPNLSLTNYIYKERVRARA